MPSSRSVSAIASQTREVKLRASSVRPTVRQARASQTKANGCVIDAVKSEIASAVVISIVLSISSCLPVSE